MSNEQHMDEKLNEISAMLDDIAQKRIKAEEIEADNNARLKNLVDLHFPSNPITQKIKKILTS